jgi:hypothetical protein
MTESQVLYALARGLALVAWIGCYWALVIFARKIVALVKRAPTRVRSSRPLNLKAVWNIEQRDES